MPRSAAAALIQAPTYVSTNACCAAMAGASAGDGPWRSPQWPQPSHVAVFSTYRGVKLCFTHVRRQGSSLQEGVGGGASQFKRAAVALRELLDSDVAPAVQSNDSRGVGAKAAVFGIEGVRVLLHLAAKCGVALVLEVVQGNG